jgi:hypothetical protein
VRFAGVAKSVGGEALTGTIGVTFLIYADQQGGAPLWLETQNVQPDASGQYSVLLGATKADGLPASLFASGAARWLSVQISGQAEQPRVLLLSVPYAMKAADADTVGGLPASAFLLATPGNTVALNAASASASQTAALAGVPSATSGLTPDAGTPVTGLGTAGYLPLWTSASNISNSGIFQASNGFLGIGTATPATGVDVANNMIVRGGFTMPPEGTATASTSYTSHSYYFQASAFNSAKNSAELQSFQWQAIPEGNNTASPSGVLNLRFAEGTASSVSTGFSIASNGILSFAPGQTFPGVPELGVANNFTGNQNVTGSLTALSTDTEGSVLGVNDGSGPGVVGLASTVGVQGSSLTNVGVLGFSVTNSNEFIGRGKAGVWGDTGGASGGGYYGVLGTADANSAGGFFNNGAYAAVVAENDGAGPGVHGASYGYSKTGASSGYYNLTGVWGDTGGPSNSDYAAITGTADENFAGIFENNSSLSDTVYMQNDAQSSASATVLYTQGGYFGGSCNFDVSGNLTCSGTISGAKKEFKIDDPIDPANKYLVHASVESSELMNIYTGNVLTDANGLATVALPTWFESLNTDFRYQLTTIGQDAHAWISQKVNGGQFAIRTNAPSVEVSWQITAVRQDPYAKAHPMVAEQEKSAQEKGTYIHPALYGQPLDKQVGAARRPKRGAPANAGAPVNPGAPVHPVATVEPVTRSASGGTTP